ncbi:MAG: AEC family transporter [Lentisphaeria bacterium]|nr:AEC family transporter [Lentisphaeria bacterium]NQZ70791.1 AEC family transporter [Lentisphaeria bacterium]
MSPIIPVIFATLSPVILLIVLGFFLREKNFLPETFFTQLNKLNYFIGLPSLLIAKLGGAGTNLGAVLPLIMSLIAATFFAVIISVMIAYLVKSDKAEKGALIHASFRGNLAYLGLPIIIYFFEGKTELHGFAAICLAPLILLYNTLAVFFLIIFSKKEQKISPKIFIGKLITNPLLIGCAIGTCLSYSSISPIALKPFELVGEFALPSALIALGASLRLDRLKGKLLLPGIASVIKLIITPLAGYLIGFYIFNLSADHLKLIMIFLATPTAVASFVLAEQMDSDTDLAATSIVLSALLCFIPIAIILAL